MSTSPNLGNIVTDPNARKALYGGYGIVGLGLGAAQVGFAAAEAGQPVWLTVSLAVYGFLGAAFATLAVGNTPKAE